MIFTKFLGGQLEKLNFQQRNLLEPKPIRARRRRKKEEEEKKTLLIYDPMQLQYNEKVWHSFTAPIYLKQNLGIHNETLLNAIYHHTLGDGNGNYDRILYIADKIEPNREYDTAEYWKVSKRNLKEGAEMVKESSKIYRESKGEV